MVPAEYLLSLLPDVGVSVRMPFFSNWVADVAVPAVTGALVWSCLQVAIDGISWFTRAISVIGPCNHVFINFSLHCKNNPPQSQKEHEKQNPKCLVVFIYL